MTIYPGAYPGNYDHGCAEAPPARYEVDTGPEGIGYIIYDHVARRRVYSNKTLAGAFTLRCDADAECRALNLAYHGGMR